VLDRARSLTSEESRALERLLAEVTAARRAADEERRSLAEARVEADRRAAEHREATESARRTVDDLRRRLTRESEVLLARARELWQLVQRDARKADKTRADAGRLKQEMQSIEASAEALQNAARPEAIGLPAATTLQTPLAVTPGARVHVKDLGIEAEVVSGPDPEGRVQLRRGAWKIQSHVAQLAPLAADARRGEPVRRVAATYDPGDVPPMLEVDLRGMDVDEAIQAVDQGLDRAVLSGFHELRIIHGIGKGVLKAAVERHLRAHAQVESQRMGEGSEGGRGVTVARLR
jgi:DNA mismatch repair protein MutS2